MRKGHQRRTVGDLCDFINGNGFRPPDWKTSGLPIIRIQNLNGAASFNYFDGEPNKKWIVEPGDLLFAWAGVKGVSFGPTIWPGPRGVLNQHIFRVVPHKGVDKYWLYLALQVATRRIEANAHGFKASLVHVQKDDITSQVVDIPPIPEQRKIAEIVRTWDEAIEKAERCLVATRVIRSAEIARAISKQDHCDPIALGDLVEPVTSKVTDQSIPILTISAESGFVEQHTYFARRIASESLHSYAILERGEFAYNRSRANGYPCGAIKRLNTLDRGAVTSLYFCFRSRSEDPGIADYLEVLFENGLLNPQLARIAKEGSRAHGLLNVAKEDFLSMTVDIPPQRTRVAIAAMRRHAIAEIAASVRRVQLLSEQKSGLMQKLLTGQVRVPGAVADLSPAAD